MDGRGTRPDRDRGEGEQDVVLVFPQLGSGAMGQYPIRKRRVARTVRNECGDGRMLKFADSGTEQTEWRLAFKELNDGEIASLQIFFEAVEGRLRSFTLLDPSGNLLAWSEDMSRPVWERNALLTVTPGLPDPVGTDRATRIVNQSGAPLRIMQTIEAPAWFQYCFSLWARGDQGGGVVLELGTNAFTRTLRPDWQRLRCAGRSESTEETIAFGLEIQPGSSLDVFGLQAEAQPGASEYKRTLSRGGIYPNARLAQDSLEMITMGPDRHSCSLAVVHADGFPS